MPSHTPLSAHNPSLGDDVQWQADGLTFTELIRQPYGNCAFSAGTVQGHPVDTLYLRWEREGTGAMLLLRPDELAALAWCATGVLWSEAVARVAPSDAV